MVAAGADRTADGVRDLGIVIVNYNTSADLLRCLESIFANPPACSFQVTVVDNASTDPHLAAVRERFTGVDWILNRQNVGYARGCNQGMASQPADWYLILNPDIVVLPGALDGLLHCGRTHPRAGIIGPQLLNDDDTIQDSCRRFYTLGTLLLRRTFLGKLLPHSGIVQRHLMRDFDHNATRPVDWVLGGCMLVSGRALERTGPMDERFFLYFEDVDWCYRMWQAGCEVLYTPDARFRHRHRRASAQGTFNRSFWLHLGSLISFYEKWGLIVWLVKRWREPLLMLLFWLVDMVCVGGGFALAYGLRSLAGRFFAQELFGFGEYLPLLIYTLLLSTVVFLGSGRYASGGLLGKPHPLRDLQRAGTIFMLLLASTYLGHMEVISRAVLLIYLPLLVVSVLGTGRLLRRLLHHLERGRLALERTLLVGDQGRIAAWLEGAGDLTAAGVDLIGYVCPGPETGALPALGGGRVPWLGGPEDLAVVVRRYRAGQVVIWPEAADGPGNLRLWGTLRRMGVRLRWLSRDAWLLAAAARVEVFGGRLAAVRGISQVTVARAAGRRLADAVVGLLMLAVCGPVRLWDRLRGHLGRRLRLCRVPLRDPWGFDPELRILAAADGSVQPLHRQWHLAWDLLRGKVTLLGPWRLTDGVRWREPDPEGMLVFWDSDPVPCALGTGGRAGAAGWVEALRDFWRHPGGLSRVEDPTAAAGRADDEPNEVER